MTHDDALKLKNNIEELYQEKLRAYGFVLIVSESSYTKETYYLELIDRRGFFLLSVRYTSDIHTFMQGFVEGMNYAYHITSNAINSALQI